MIEFALSELAVFELGRETLPGSLLLVEGRTTVSFESDHVVPAELRTYGDTVADFQGAQVPHAELHSEGTGIGQLVGSALTGAEFSASGEPATQFDCDLVDPTTLPVEGVADASFDGGADVNVELHVAGDADAQLVSGSVGNTRFAFSGTAEAKFAPEFLNISDWNAGGLGTFAPLAATKASSTWYAPSVGAALFKSSRKIGVTFKSVGKAEAHFDVPSEPEFYIRGRAGVLFEGESTVEGETHAAGVGEQRFVGQSVVRARFDTSAHATVNFGSGIKRVGRLGSVGEATTKFVSGKVAGSELQSAAWSAAKYAGGRIRNVTFAFDGAGDLVARSVRAVSANVLSAGVGDFAFAADATANATLTLVGKGALKADGQTVKPARLASDGGALVELRIGAAVLRFMPEAYDTVIREFEPRGVERPFEEREAEFA